MNDEELIAAARDLVPQMADRIEALLKERDEAQIRAEFFQSEVKLRNRIPATADPAAVLMRQLDTAEAKLAKAVEAIKSAEAAITLEINPNNYDHDLVCQLNDETTEAVLILRAALAELESK